jgi:hypothetical protein
MPDAVVMVVRCLEPGCDAGEHRSSVGIEMDDQMRMDSAECFVNFAARHCRNRHAAGVEVSFSDDTRKIVFSKSGGTWTDRN